jgi:hypothetical protein
VKRASALRNILVRKSIRMFPAGAAALAVSGLLLATSPPASAQVSFHWCETNGSYCIGAPSLALYDPVVETTTGRLLYTPSSGTTNNFKLQFAADQTKCVAASNSGDHVVIHPCNGSGVVWIPTDINGNNGSELLESNEFPGKYLSGDNMGHQFQLKSHGASGWFQRFSER